MGEKIKRAEFLLAIVIAIVLIGSLLSQEILKIPKYVIVVLILAFVLTKTYDIIKKKGTILEDYISLGIIILFGIIQFLIDNKQNPVMTTVIVFVLIYSVGLMPWINDILKSKKVTLFILSYGLFILMIIFLFSGAFFANSSEFKEGNQQKALTFEEAIYFSTMTFTTVGYGDIVPTGINRLIASLEAVIGVTLNIAFIGYILSSRRFTPKK